MSTEIKKEIQLEIALGSGELRRDLRYQALAKAGLFLEPNASSAAR